MILLKRATWKVIKRLYSYTNLVFLLLNQTCWGLLLFNNLLAAKVNMLFCIFPPNVSIIIF